MPKYCRGLSTPTEQTALVTGQTEVHLAEMRMESIYSQTDERAAFLLFFATSESAEMNIIYAISNCYEA